jgi:hypothetical protein
LQDVDDRVTMFCESTDGGDGDASFNWFKVSRDDDDGSEVEVELTNIVGGGVVVAGGELQVAAIFFWLMSYISHLHM